MSFLPKPQQIYRHFKGALYQIVTVAEHTETGETLVVYQAMYGDFKIYARPLSMFCSKVDRDKYPDVKQEYRFELQQSGYFNIEAERSCEEPDVLKENAETKTASVNVPEIKQEAIEPDMEETGLDPMLLAFLDAESYMEKLNILAGMHHRITDDMITTMAIASDIEIEEGDLEDRYTQLKNCLVTLDRYEITRLR